MPVAAGGITCWPSHPRYELIEDGDKLKASGINLESQWAKRLDGQHEQSDPPGVDYDLVVLGISVGALGSICGQLVKHLPKWGDMIKNVDTVAAQAMQLSDVANARWAGWPLPAVAACP